MKKIKCFLFLLLSTVYSIRSQDIHFSQFNENSSLVNPALTGASHVLKASLIYKDQWRSVTVPYKTYGASFEMKFKATNWAKTSAHATEKYKQAFNRLAGGISFFSDKAGDGNMGITQANFSLATFVPVNSVNTLSFGLQASLAQKKIDYDKLIWPDQYNGSGYDAGLNSGENFSSGNFIYPDFASGILWSYGYNSKAIAANDQFKIDAGFSMYHINQPKQNFLSANNKKLYSKYIIHANSLMGIKNSNLSLAPSFIFHLQGPSKEIIVGTLFKYTFREDSKYTGYMKSYTLSMGGFYRLRDALIATAQVEFGKYAIGFSYDINTSGLTKASSARGGFEIFLRFVNSTPYLYQKRSAKFG